MFRRFRRTRFFKWLKGDFLGFVKRFADLLVKHAPVGLKFTVGAIRLSYLDFSATTDIVEAVLDILASLGSSIASSQAKRTSSPKRRTALRATNVCLSLMLVALIFV